MRLAADLLPMLRFLLVFVVLVFVLFGLELLEPVERLVIVPFTSLVAKASGVVIRLIDADAIVQGKIISSPAHNFAISIERGCNGVEAMIIFGAALAAFPAPWRHKLLGLGIGFAAIQALNLVRIVSLFYLGRWNMAWFEWFHLYLWQALMVLDALIVFLLWLRSLPRPGGPAPAPLAT